MKKITSIQLKKSAKILYHFFALTGMVGSLFFVLSWSKAEENVNSSKESMIEKSIDVNINSENAKRAIEAYRLRFHKQNGNNPPKGYFVSRASITWMLENVNYNGIYVYPAISEQGIVCTIAEPGISKEASHRIIDGIAGRIIITESPCPNDCGSLGQ